MVEQADREAADMRGHCEGCGRTFAAKAGYCLNCNDDVTSDLPPYDVDEIPF